jgi:small subunit ribosomal protein S17
MTDNENSQSEQTTRGTRKELTGTVTSADMDKTIVVRVDRLARHALYKKTINLQKKFYAHDENNQAKVGDKVRIMGTKPLSKTKRWRLVEVIS